MPTFPVVGRFNHPMLGTHSLDSVGGLARSVGLAISASAAWPSANLAIFIPVPVYQPVTIAKMSVLNGSAVSGNIDVGIYDRSWKRLVRAGSTAQSGTSSIQIFDITDTFLNKGLYFLGVALDNTTGTLAGYSFNNALELRSAAIYQQASAFALPDPFSGAAMAQTFAPIIGMTPKTTL